MGVSVVECKVIVYYLHASPIIVNVREGMLLGSNFNDDCVLIARWTSTPQRGYEGWYVSIYWELQFLTLHWQLISLVFFSAVDDGVKTVLFSVFGQNSHRIFFLSFHAIGENAD